jgi:hypothetical protein
MGRESKKNRELRQLAELLGKLAYHRNEIDKLWVKIEALQAKMKLPKRSRLGSRL